MTTARVVASTQYRVCLSCPPVCESMLLREYVLLGSSWWVARRQKTNLWLLWLHCYAAQPSALVWLSLVYYSSPLTMFDLRICDRLLFPHRPTHRTAWLWAPSGWLILHFNRVESSPDSCRRSLAQALLDLLISSLKGPSHIWHSLTSHLRI